MIPQPGRVLTDLAVKLAMSIAPETTSSFAMANTGLISMLMLSLAQDSERAVANRMADIEEMKTLFRSNDAQPAPGADPAGRLLRERADRSAPHRDGCISRGRPQPANRSSGVGGSPQPAPGRSNLAVSAGPHGAQQVRSAGPVGGNRASRTRSADRR